MFNSNDFETNRELNDLENLIRSAGQYVRPSDDLRPAVLEEARVSRGERWAQHWIWHVALAMTVWAILVSTWQVEAPPERELTEPAGSASQMHENPSWQTVDRLSALRRRQAAMFRWWTL